MLVQQIRPSDDIENGRIGGEDFLLGFTRSERSKLKYRFVFERYICYLVSETHDVMIRILSDIRYVEC